MSRDVIEIEGLTKEYRGRGGRRVAALDGLDLAIPEAGVFGFLGPNGSGKTTTIRCLLGLVRPTRGRLHLLGRPVPGALRDAVRRVGAIVETPALFPTMTGRENLLLLGAVDGIATRAGWTRCWVSSGSTTAPATSCGSTPSACGNVSRSRLRC